MVRDHSENSHGRVEVLKMGHPDFAIYQMWGGGGHPDLNNLLSTQIVPNSYYKKTVKVQTHIGFFFKWLCKFM